MTNMFFDLQYISADSLMFCFPVFVLICAPLYLLLIQNRSFCLMEEDFAGSIS